WTDQLVQAGAAHLAELARDDEAGVDTESCLDSEPTVGLQPGARSLRLRCDRQRGTRRAASIVLVRVRVAERKQDAVGHDAGDMAIAAAGELTDDRVLRVQERVHLLQISRSAINPGDAQAAADQCELAALAGWERLRPDPDISVPQLVQFAETQGLQHALDSHVALLDLLGRDGFEQAPDTLLAHPRRDGDGVRADLLDDDLLRRTSAHSQLSGQALEEDE